MFKDFGSFRNQFLAVFLMALTGVLIYTGMEGVWMGMQDYENNWAATSNRADAWVSGLNLDDSDVDRILSLPDVAQAQASSLLTTRVAGAEAYVLLAAAPDNTVSRPFITKGRDYNPAADGIWLYQDFAESHGLAVGKTISLENRGIVNAFEIMGLVQSPDYLSYTGSSVSIKPDRHKYGYGYVSLDTMTLITGGDLSYNQIKIKIRDDAGGKASANMASVKKSIEHILGPKYAGFATESEFKGTSAYLDKYAQVRIMSILFSIIFILLAMLTIQTTIKRLVETQRIQVGTFKALGYTNGSLLRHYSLFGFLISASGSLAGYFLAPYIVTNRLMAIQKDLFSLPEWIGKNTPISLLVAAVIVLGCTISARQACHKVIKEMPAITMRGEPPKNHMPIFLERFKLWQSFSYDWQWILRDASRNKIRFLIGIIGIIGSTTLLMASFGLRDSLTTTNEKLFGHQFSYGAKIVFQPFATEDQKNELLTLAGGNPQLTMEGDIEIRTATQETIGTLLVIDQGAFVHLEDTKGNTVELPNSGLVISRKLADELGVRVNDTIQFRHGFQPGATGSITTLSAVVQEIVTPPAPQGLYISRKSWETLAQPFAPNTLLTKNIMAADKTKGNPFAKETVTLDQQITEAGDVLSSIMMVIIMLLAAAILLSVIIQYNLGILSFTERSREYATLKVIGYRKNEIKSVIRKRSQLQVLIGLILGIPIGFQFLKIYVPIISTRTLEFSPYLKPQSLVISLLIVVVCSYGVTFVVAAKSESLDMVAALKSVE
jgi:putative ABC transport system permease protein